MSSKGKARKKRMAKRSHKLPMEYIEAMADRIVRTNPTIDIVRNTLVGHHSLAYTRGYSRHMADESLFRQRRQKAIDEDWNATRDMIDDLVHNKAS